ncbi:MAG: tetratricopeptide repeat protein [Deltaproteobacteria bacterium]|nr:tetratricopeptide repeat protein [Deltaproteobacteria bacterium]
MRPELPSGKNLDPEYLQSQASYHFSLGQAHSLEGDSDKAIEEYKLALVYDSQSAIVHTRLAGEYVKKGLLTFAIDECKTAVGQDPKYVDARLLLAGLYSSTRLVAEALEQYDEVLKIDPSNSEAFVFKASLLIDEGREQEAINVLNKLLADDPDFFWGYYYLGRAYQKMGKAEPAIKAYRKALALKPSFPQGGLMLGVLLEEQKRPAEAIKVYEELYKNTGDAQAVGRLAQIHIEKEDFEKALKYLTILEQADEDNLNVKVKIGLIHVEKRRFDRAIDTFRAILEKNKDAERVRYYLASVYEELKRYDEAIEEFRKISASSAIHVDALVHIGNLYRLKGDMAKAMATAENGIETDPDSPQIHLFKASLLEEEKRLAQAAEFLEKTRGKFPKDEKVLYYLGSIYDKMNNQEAGIKVMSDLLALNPENVQALNYLGYTYVSRGEKMDLAESYILHAMKLRPGDGYIQDTYGFFLLRNGNVRKATVELEKAYKIKPDEAVIVEHLGDAYLRSNLKRKALEKYQEASKLMVDAKSEPEEIRKIDAKIQELKSALNPPGDAAKAPPRKPAKQ